MALCHFMLGENENALKYLLKSFELNSTTEFNFLDDFPNLESTHLYVNLTGTI